MSRRRPLYVRLLGVRHLHLHPVAILILFEGSVAVGLLLALADLIHLWGVVLVPVAVALAVKLNDVVEGILRRPLAATHERAVRLAAMAVAVGRSPVPPPLQVAVGIAPAPAASRLDAPTPGASRLDDPAPEPDGPETRGADPAIVSATTVHPVNVRPEHAHTDEAERPGPSNQGRFTS